MQCWCDVVLQFMIGNYCRNEILKNKEKTTFITASCYHINTIPLQHSNTAKQH